MNKQELLKKLADARDISADLDVYGPIMDAIEFIENVPEWVDRSECGERELEGVGCYYVCKMETGETRIMSKIDDYNFQTIGGSSEGREDWYGGIVPRVVKWSPIYVPEVV